MLTLALTLLLAQDGPTHHGTCGVTIMEGVQVQGTTAHLMSGLPEHTLSAKVSTSGAYQILTPKTLPDSGGLRFRTVQESNKQRDQHLHTVRYLRTTRAPLQVPVLVVVE